MKRVRIEYGKALVMALCAATLLALGVGERTLDTAGLTILSAALCVYFVLKARVVARASARHGCGQAPRA